MEGPMGQERSKVFPKTPHTTKHSTQHTTTQVMLINMMKKEIITIIVI
jgi:hypothetical protein